jgi:hypothetical protein
LVSVYDSAPSPVIVIPLPPVVTLNPGRVETAGLLALIVCAPLAPEHW